MERLIVFDSKKCISCHSCEVACQLENEVSPGVQPRWVKTHTEGMFPHSHIRAVSVACFHCENPSCVSACPTGALIKRNDGVVEHIQGRCIGCRYCVQSCPFHVPKFSPREHIMRKCSFCIQRTDEGRSPACVAKCPTGALAYYPDKKHLSGAEYYGVKEGLHMVYRLDGRARDFGLPEPVPLNTVTWYEIWKWIAGFVPGAAVIFWLLKASEKGQEDV